MVSVPESATRVAMLERGEADIIYNVPGELINKVKNSRVMGAGAVRLVLHSSSPASRTRRTRSATSACARR